MLESLAVGAFALAIASTAAYADGHDVCGIDLTETTPSAVISGQVKTVGYIVGLRWGNGVLTLSNGERRKFSILGTAVQPATVSFRASTNRRPHRKAAR